MCLVACLAFPLGWNALFPKLKDAEIHFTLTDSSPRIATHNPVIEGSMQVVDEGTIPSIFGITEYLTFEFIIEHAGKYSIFGASLPTLSPALELSVNDDLISNLAFYVGSTLESGGLKAHRIATQVHFDSGPNSVYIEGTNVSDRTLFLVLREELPLTFGRFAVLFVLISALYVMLLSLPMPDADTPAKRVAFTLGTLSVLGIIVPAILLSILSADRLDNLGTLNPDLKRALDGFEDTLESDEHRERTKRTWNIAIFGDSTHFMYLAPDQRMIPSLQRAMPEEMRENTYIYGVSTGAFSAVDFYFLLNRIVPYEPDLIVLPANQRWFSEQRMYGTDFLDAYRLEGYARFSEFPRLLPLTVGDREFGLRQMLFYRMDWGPINRPADTGIGSKVWARRRMEFLEHTLREKLPGRYPPIPFHLGTRAGPYYRDWDDAISEDHDLFKMYRLINQLAKKHGIAVLYYSVNQNVEAQASQGIDLKLAENTDVIRRNVTNDSHVYFLDLAKSNPLRIFADANDHLTPEGMAGVSGRLAEAAARILGIDGSSERIPDLYQGPIE